MGNTLRYIDKEGTQYIKNESCIYHLAHNFGDRDMYFTGEQKPLYENVDRILYHSHDITNTLLSNETNYPKVKQRSPEKIKATVTAYFELLMKSELFSKHLVKDEEGIYYHVDHTGEEHCRDLMMVSIMRYAEEKLAQTMLMLKDTIPADEYPEACIAGLPAYIGAHVYGGGGGHQVLQPRKYFASALGKGGEGLKVIEDLLTIGGRAEPARWLAANKKPFIDNHREQWRAYVTRAEVNRYEGTSTAKS